MAVTIAAGMLVGLLAGVPPAGAQVAPPRDATGAATSPTTGPGGFTALVPARILDTRLAVGTPGTTPIGPGGTLTFHATGQGGIPATGVDAVALNVTVTEPTASGWLTLWPAGLDPPLASNLNFVAGQTVPNAVVVKVGSGGDVSIFNSAGTTHVVVDVAGWYATGPTVGSPYTGLVPRRLLDTRDTGTPVGPDASVHLDLTGLAPGVVAVALNVTVTQPTGTGYLTIWPSGTARPYASSLNFVPGLTRANMVAVATGATGVDIYNSAGTSHVVVDLQGYWGGLTGGGLFTGVTPTRVLDTRLGLGQPTAAPVGPGQTIEFTPALTAGIPAGKATSVVLNVTATEGTAGGYLTVFPAGAARPLASNLNFGVSDNVPNLVIAQLGGSGGVSIYNQLGDTHVVADLLGWFDQNVFHPAAGGVKDSGLPPDVVIDPTSTFAYISNPTMNEVEVLRLATGTTEAPILVGSQPSGLDLTPAGDRLYVADTGSSFVSVVDVATRTELRRIAIPSGFSSDTPYSLAVLANHKVLLTTTFGGSGFGAKMVEINTDTDAVTTRNDFFLGGTTEKTMIRASGDRQSAVVVAGDISSGPVFRYDAGTNAFTPESDTSGFRGNIATNGNGTVIVVNGGGLVLDGQLRLAGSIPDCGTAGIAVNAAGTIAYALGNGAIAVCSLTRFLTVASIPIGDSVSHGFFGGNRLARSPDGHYLVGITDTGVVLVRL